MPLTPAWPRFCRSSSKTRAIAVTSAKRLPALPEVPALAEHPGLEGYDVVNWFGLFAPGGTPPEVIDRVNAAVRSSPDKPEMHARLEGMGTLPSPDTPAEFATFVATETTKFGEIIEQAQIKEQ
jgi:tripartite-type tricarboxylate transporter receptor subunit TctC